MNVLLTFICAYRLISTAGIKIIIVGSQNNIKETSILKEDEAIDWNKPAHEIFCQIRGLAPAPGAYTMWNGGSASKLFNNSRNAASLTLVGWYTRSPNFKARVFTSEKANLLPLPLGRSGWVIVKTLDALAEGTLEPRKQAEEQATYAARILKEDEVQGPRLHL